MTLVLQKNTRGLAEPTAGATRLNQQLAVGMGTAVPMHYEDMRARGFVVHDRRQRRRRSIGRQRRVLHWVLETNSGCLAEQPAAATRLRNQRPVGRVNAVAMLSQRTRARVNASSFFASARRCLMVLLELSAMLIALGDLGPTDGTMPIPSQAS